MDEDDNETSCVVTTNNGSVASIAANTELQAIYKCTVSCSIGASMMTPVGTLTCPTPSKTNFACLKFTILSVKAYNVAENVCSISLSGTKMKSRML